MTHGQTRTACLSRRAQQPFRHLPLLGDGHGGEAFHLDWMQWFERHTNGILRRRPIPGKLVEALPGRNNFTQLSRVPVKALFENLEDGATVDDFLQWFPGVNREQVDAVLEFAAHSLEPAVAG